MKTQFTPGPWRVNGDSIVGPFGNTIAECFGYSVRATSADQKRQGGREANARLIAAAPELLAIVRALLPHANNEWTRLDDLAHRGNRESEDSAMELDRLIEHARETIQEITEDNQ